MPETETSLPDLYLADETAWLEAMAERIAAGAYTELDYHHLREYLTDMAGRERREVESRLVVLLMHVLKWLHQPEKRSRSWKLSILGQRRELVKQARRGVLRNHALAAIAEAYRDAVVLAAAETGLPETVFPAECPYSLDELMSFDPKEDLQSD